MEFISKKIEEYAKCYTQKESSLLKEVYRETWSKVMMPRMISGHIQGRVLSLFSNIIKPKNVLEIGTYTGYSALCLAEGIQKNGTIHTIEINEEYISKSKNFFEKSKFKNNIKQYYGNGKDIVKKIEKKFQLIFIDADKESYCKYFDLIINKLDINGVIIADNVLWSGKILNTDKDKETKALHNFNIKVTNDVRVENILLPVRDGLMICRKVSN